EPQQITCACLRDSAQVRRRQPNRRGFEAAQCAAAGPRKLVRGEAFMPQDLDWLLSPISSRTFFESYFEKKPLHVRDRPLGFYESVFAPADLRAAIYQSEELIRRNVKTSGMFSDDPHRSSPGLNATTAVASWIRATLAGGESLLIWDF